MCHFSVHQKTHRNLLTNKKKKPSYLCEFIDFSAFISSWRSKKRKKKIFFLLVSKRIEEQQQQQLNSQKISYAIVKSALKRKTYSKLIKNQQLKKIFDFFKKHFLCLYKKILFDFRLCVRQQSIAVFSYEFVLGKIKREKPTNWKKNWTIYKLANWKEKRSRKKFIKKKKSNKKKCYKRFQLRTKTARENNNNNKNLSHTKHTQATNWEEEEE